MSIEARGKGVWRIRIYDSGGVQRERKITGSKAEAEAFAARFRIELESQSPEQAARRTVPTFSQFCAEDYLPHARLHLRKGVLYQREHYLTTLILTFGDTRLNQIRPKQIDAFASKRLADGLRPISVNNELRILARVHKFALDRGISVPKLAIRYLNEGERRTEAWNESEIAALLNACSAGDLERAKVAETSAGFRAVRPWNPRAVRFGSEVLPALRATPIVLFLANTGCRKGEAVALEWDNVDFGRKEIRIWPSAVWRPKNGKPREIPISDSLLKLLQDELLVARSKWVFSKTNGEQYGGFPRWAFAKAIADAGLTGGPHKLRHTFASMFLARCPDTGVLAEILGHSDEAVTRLYAHMLPGRLAKARNVVSIGITETDTPGERETA